MNPMRTAHDPERDILRGLTPSEARDEADRLTLKANELTTYLSRARAGLTSLVRANLERERNSLEMESADWSARVAEFTGQILRVREPEPVRVRAAR